MEQRYKVRSGAFKTENYLTPEDRDYVAAANDPDSIEALNLGAAIEQKLKRSKNWRTAYKRLDWVDQRSLHMHLLANAGFDV